MDLERLDNMYYGPLFVGQHYISERVFYDTTSQWVTINDMGIANTEMISNYEATNSDTAVQQLSESGEPLEYSVDYGDFSLQGKEWKDKMCLDQNRNRRMDDTGRLCVRNMPFLAVDTIIGSLEASGTIGLAPHYENKSYVYQLWEQSQI